MRRLLRAGTLMVREPKKALIRAVAGVSPAMLFQRSAKLAARQGLTRPYFILSFDCDTDEDIAVVESVHSRLLGIGISPVYAVPGAKLELGREVYRRIADTGAEFISHGYREHCRFNPATKTYDSDVFYDQMSRETVVDDIRLGRQTFIDLFGRVPQGFRAPHFGTFQKPDHLHFLHSTLRGLGYVYSSSTTPIYGFQNGPIYDTGHGILEIAVSGCYDDPLMILDSYGFRYAANRTVTEDDYIAQFKKMAAGLISNNTPGLLNYYADPSQVHDWPAFFECMESVASIAVSSYEGLLRAKSVGSLRA